MANTSATPAREFDPTTGRITLTKAHLNSDSGQRLVQLILEIGLDGELSDDELTKLAEWLQSAPAEIPAIRHLRELVADAREDGVISEEERKILHKQIERVLPATERERLVLARKAFEEKRRAEKQATDAHEREAYQKMREDERAAREQERQREWQQYNQPTEPQLRYIQGLGGRLPNGATRKDASDLIDRLVHSNGSISPRQHMVLRFWGVTPEPDWGKAQVSVWMDTWYEQDANRQLAWELFKEETGDTGTRQDPELVPFGAGYKYLKRVRTGSPETHDGPSMEKKRVLWPWILGAAALGVVGLAFCRNTPSPSSNVTQPSAIASSASPSSSAPASPLSTPTEGATQPTTTALIRPSLDAALDAVGHVDFLESPQQIPATVIDVGILKNVPYLSYRIGDNRELNIYGDPDSPACIEIGLYRSMRDNKMQQTQCLVLLQKIFPDMDLGSVRMDGGKSLKGDWVIEVTMPDSPDAYGGWWVSVYNLARLHQANGTTANISVVSESASASRDWTPQEMSYARPSSTSSSSHRVYVKGYTRKDGTYVRAHTRSKR